MHVNAEVIFYGGTDPRAKVTIDGHPVALNPDGSFRYHFIFPDADYEIPIVATSPDGLETRSAKLRFERSTGKVGIVTDTHSRHSASLWEGSEEKFIVESCSLRVVGAATAAHGCSYAGR